MVGRPGAGPSGAGGEGPARHQAGPRGRALHLARRLQDDGCGGHLVLRQGPGPLRPEWGLDTRTSARPPEVLSRALSQQQNGRRASGEGCSVWRASVSLSVKWGDSDGPHLAGVP